MNMDEHVNKLAELQAELEAEEAKADEASALTDASITDVKDELAELEKERAFERRQYIQSMQEINATIKKTETQIIDAWDGEKRTVRYGAGLLKFRTTTSLKIHDGQILLDNLIHHFPTYVIVEEYISGFNKTQVRKFIDLHPQSHGVIELVPKTSVKLEVKSD